nr:hypothetical protein Iba_scaffold7103CG0660 [Ipomoea batatas]
MVPETPLDGLPPQSENASAMQIENTPAAPVAGEQDVVAEVSQNLPSGPQDAVRPRSYLDSVVGHGSEAAPFLVYNLNVAEEVSSSLAYPYRCGEGSAIGLA